jgi:hypothetical protein
MDGIFTTAFLTVSLMYFQSPVLNPIVFFVNANPMIAVTSACNMNDDKTPTVPKPDNTKRYPETNFIAALRTSIMSTALEAEMPNNE